MENEGLLPHSQQTPSMPTLSQIKPVHVASHSLKIRFNTTLPTMLMSTKYSLSLLFLNKNLYA